ncbi:MAG: FAD-dependent oxidoreductase, partial [Firmicutes bacterium]|nr:FAD-dependent oxidoreductase [Bacillota bacterium]
HKLFGLKTTDEEYWGLREILNEDEVDIALSMKQRAWYTEEELYEKHKKNMSPEKFKETLDLLCVHGFVEYDYGDHYDDNGPIPNAPKELRYRTSYFVPGSAELFNSSVDRIEKNPPVAKMFERMTFLPLEHITSMVRPGGNGIGMHVIPVEKEVQATREALSLEKISYWLQKYEGHLSAGICSCRASRAKIGEGCTDDEKDWCIQVGDMADYTVETGRAHYITKEEALDILKKAEENGYVHQVTNIDGSDHIFDICNCNVQICNALRTSLLFNTPNMSRSAYTAKVNKENCVACGKCVEVCPVGAAKLGQKLCTKHGEVEYPVTELPDNKKWTADNWNIHYREDAKINCYDSGTAPCKTACPAHLAVQGYVKMAAEGRYLEALKLIKQDNPFPAVCGAVCNRRCEDACTRGTVDQPIAIDEIKKFIADRELKEENRFIPICEKDDGGMWGPDYKMAVIGGGPAGLSCAYYLRTRGYDVTVFEKEERPGGMLVYGIPNFRLEKDVIDAEIDVLRQMGVEFRCGVEVGRDVTIPSLREEGYKAFYLAIGLQGGRNTGVPGEDAQGVESGVSFLRRINRDNSLKLDGDVVVVGGGNVAVDVARSAARATGGKVTMLCLESEAEMPAAKDEVDEAKEEDIVVMNGWGPKEILTENGKVTGVVFKKCVSVFDKDKKFAPVYDENETVTIPCANVLEAIGQSAVWGDLLKDTKVELRPNGTVVHDPVTFETAEPDIFVGGDIGHGARFAIDAIADGKLACESMHRSVHPGQSQTVARDLRQFIELDKDDIVLENFDNAKRQIPGHKQGKAKETFDDLRLPFTEDQVKTEAARCLGCGATTVDLNRCIGCGLCTTRCEFDAIHLSRDLPHASDMVKCEDKLLKVGPYALKRIVKTTFGGKK